MSFSKVSRLGLTIAVPLLLVEGLAAQSAPGSEPARGSLAWHATKARNEGKSAVTLGPTIFEYPESEPSLDEALVRSTVLVASLLESKTSTTEFQILTWRKYRIVERLAMQSRELPPQLDQNWQAELALAPKSMLPLASDEFLTDDYGGTAKIDGVTITMTRDGTQDLPVGGRHLVFVLFDSSRQLGGPCYGPGSLFTVDESDTLHARFSSFDSDQNPMLHEIRQRANGKLAGLRALAASVAKSH